MKKDLCQLVKDVVVYGSGDIVSKSVYFLTLPILTRVFTTEEYGIWSFINTGIGLLSAILIVGGDSAYSKYFFEAKNFEEKQIVTSTWFGFLAFWSVGIVIFSLPFTSLFSVWSFNTEKHQWLLLLALITAPLNIMNSMCGQALRNQFQSSLFTALNIITTIVMIGFSLFALIILKLGLYGVLGANLIANLIILPIRVWTIRQLICKRFSKNLLKHLLAFGIPLVPTSLAYWVFTSSDRFVLGKLSTLSQLGLYTVASTIISGLNLALGAFGQAWSPYAFKIYEEDPKNAKKIFGEVLVYILIIFGMLCVGVSIFSNEILRIMASPVYFPAAVAIGPLALGFVGYASTQITSAGISLTKQTQYFAIFSWIAACLNLGLNLIFIPKWGMIAASWTTAISYVFLTIAYGLTSQKLWPIYYDKEKIMKISGLILLYSVLASYISEMKYVYIFIIKILMYSSFICFLFILRIIEKQTGLELYEFIKKEILRSKLS